MTYKEEYEAYMLSLKNEYGWQPETPDPQPVVTEMIERYAREIVLKQGDKFLVDEIVSQLGTHTHPASWQFQIVQRLCERMKKEKPVNGRKLYQSPDRHRRFFWIEE